MASAEPLNKIRNRGTPAMKSARKRFGKLLYRHQTEKERLPTFAFSWMPSWENSAARPTFFP
jgi:hypothetical protein